MKTALFPVLSTYLLLLGILSLPACSSVLQATRMQRPSSDTQPSVTLADRPIKLIDKRFVFINYGLQEYTIEPPILSMSLPIGYQWVFIINDSSQNGGHVGYWIIKPIGAEVVNDF